jgi:hypothetical protein
VPRGSGVSLILYNLYISDTNQTSVVSLALFADDTCLYETDRKEGYVLRVIRRCPNSMAAWRERCNIKINEDKFRAIYLIHRNRRPDSLLTFNVRNIPFVTVKYLGVILDRE